MHIYYKNTFKFLNSFQKNIFIKILCNILIFIFILFLTYDFNYYQHNHIQYTTEINDKNNQEYVPSFHQFDMYKIFENIENEISNKNFKKDDFKYNYHKFTFKEEKKSLSFYGSGLVDSSFLFTENNNYIIKDEYNILSMAQINYLKNKFYYDFENVIKNQYKQHSTFSGFDESGDIEYNSYTYEKQEINFYNQYDGLHYSILTQKNKIEIQFYTDKKRDFNSLQKIIILEPNKIYFENNKSFAYNKIKYNKNVDEINLSIKISLYYYILIKSLYIFLFLFIINFIPSIIKKITFYLYKYSNNSLKKESNKQTHYISDLLILISTIFLIYFIIIFFSQLNSIYLLNNKKFRESVYFYHETPSKKELMYFINEIDNIKNDTKNTLQDNSSINIINKSYSNEFVYRLVDDNTIYVQPTQLPFVLFHKNDFFSIKDKNNKVIFSEFKQEQINKYKEIQHLQSGTFIIDNKIYKIVVSRDDFTRIEVTQDYYIYNNKIAFNKKEYYLISDGLVTYYNTDIEKINNNSFGYKSNYIYDKEGRYFIINNLFVSLILLTLALSYRRKYFFKENKKNVIEIINVDNKITIEKTN